MKCVVPIITPATASVAVPELSRTCHRAVVIPPVTSSVVGVLILATTVKSSMRTASVFVPPTSIPIRSVIESCLPQLAKLALSILAHHLVLAITDAFRIVASPPYAAGTSH